MSGPLCRHGLPRWQCADYRDPLRAPGTDDEPMVPLHHHGLIPLLIAAAVILAFVIWRALR